MRIFVKVKVGAKKENVEKIDDSHFIVFVKERPIRGLANKAVEKALADYFKVGVLRVSIVSGFKSHQKRVIIE